MQHSDFTPGAVSSETTPPPVQTGSLLQEVPNQGPALDRERLYEQFQPLFGSLLRRYGRTSELRQDLQGEIYYQFAQLLESYDPARGIPIQAYLHRMLTQRLFNHVRDYWRRETRLVPVSDEQEWEQIVNASPASEATAGTAAPDTALLEQEQRSSLLEGIDRLPPRQRRVIMGRYYEARTFEELAEELGVQPSTVRSLLRHGIARLREQFQAEEA